MEEAREGAKLAPVASLASLRALKSGNMPVK
jgi:hypothetical protein